MKKLLPILFFALGSLAQTFAQTDKDYKDLLTLFVSEKYDKCLYKAEGYTLKDETKKDPLPYMFMSRCYFEMSKRDQYKEKFPDAFKNAMKYISKYGQKDKERKYAAEYEDFFSDLRLAAMLEAESMMDALKYTKAKTLYDQITDMDPNDAGAYLMLGVSQHLMKAKKESELSIKTARTILTDKKASTAKEQLSLMRDAITKYATILNDAGNKTSAKEWLDLGMEYLKDDKEYKVTYDMIAG